MRLSSLWACLAPAADARVLLLGDMTVRLHLRLLFCRAVWAADLPRSGWLAVAWGGLGWLGVAWGGGYDYYDPGLLGCRGGAHGEWLRVAACLSPCLALQCFPVGVQTVDDLCQLSQEEFSARWCLGMHVRQVTSSQSVGGQQKTGPGSNHLPTCPSCRVGVSHSLAGRQ